MGILATYAFLATKYHTITISQHLFFVGLSAYVGYLVIGALSWVAAIFSQVDGNAIFWFLLLFFSLLASSKIYLALKASDTLFKKTIHQASYSSISTTETALGVIGFFWLSITLGFILHEAIYRPTTGWDTLSYWAKYSQIIFIFQDSGIQERFSNEALQHPKTILAIASWGARFANYAPGTSFLFFPWFSVYLGTVISLIGLAMHYRGNAAVAIFIPILFATNPLTESHVAIGGYADLWLGIGLFYSTALSVFRKTIRTRQWVFFSLCLITSLAILKRAGFTYSLASASALLAAFIFTQTKPPHRPYLVLFGVFFAASVIMISPIISIELAGSSFKINYKPILPPAETQELFTEKWHIIVRNIYAAFITNSSFSFVLLLIVVINILWLRGVRTLDAPIEATLSTMVTNALFVHLIISQFFSSYFLSYSYSYSDSSLTRASHGLFFLSVLALLINGNKNRKLR